jgi:hypothetical protein
VRVQLLTASAFPLYIIYIIYNLINPLKRRHFEFGKFKTFRLSFFHYHLKVISHYIFFFSLGNSNPD